MRLLEKGPVESVYLLTSTTEKQSVMLFMAAGQSFFNRNYEKALVFALQAQYLKYQPIGSLENFINLVKDSLRNSR